MTVINEFREERTDVYSFWEGDNKIEETTVFAIEKRIAELQEKLAIEQSKLELISEL